MTKEYRFKNIKFVLVDENGYFITATGGSSLNIKDAHLYLEPPKTEHLHFKKPLNVIKVLEEIHITKTVGLI